MLDFFFFFNQIQTQGDPLVGVSAIRPGPCTQVLMGPKPSWLYKVIPDMPVYGFDLQLRQLNNCVWQENRKQF